MSLKRFLNQTCKIYSVTRTNNKWTQETVKTLVYNNIKCFLYEEKRKQQVDSISSENQLGNIVLLLEPSKTSVKKSFRVVVDDTDLWNLWEYIVEVVEIHRSFTWIWWISLILKKLEDGEN